MRTIFCSIILFGFGIYIDIFQKYFDNAVYRRLKADMGLSDSAVNIMSQKIYNHKIKFIKLQKKIDIMIANYHKI